MASAARDAAGLPIGLALLIFGTLFFLLSCHENDDLHPTCPARCYDGPRWALRYGPCRAGKPFCPDGEHPVSCDGEILPADSDPCDGIDNDCNGYVDDGARSRDSGCPPQQGVCLGHWPICVDGAWDCRLPPDYESTETRCDGLDNDCDGQTDEGLGGDPCWDGPDGAAFLPCHPGFERCRNGAWTCEGEQLPSPEICDGIDNDCDGIVDNGARPLDIGYVIDVSGSMTPRIGLAKAAAEGHAQGWTGAGQAAVAVVDLPFGLTPIGGAPWAIVLGLSPAAQASGAIQPLAANGTTGMEPSLDALLSFCEAAPEWGAWQPGAGRVAFIWTDEMPQSYGLTPPLTLGDVAAACAAAGAIVVAFVPPGTPGWLSIAPAIRVEDLSSDVAAMIGIMDAAAALAACGS